MKVLISTAGGHGSADEIGGRIASALQQGVPSAEGAAVDIGDLRKLAQYAGFGHWLDTATRFAERHAEELRA